MHLIEILSCYVRLQNGYRHGKPVRSSCPSSSSSLPELNGLLSKKVPSITIELANTEVAKLKEQHGRGSYLPAQRFEIRQVVTIAH